jgi:8-oxo-dGTP pyrophosphatase MutT (NUDIX family)
MDTPRVEGVIAVIRHQGRFLLIQRAAHVPVPSVWCLPGGAVKPGETQPQALAREVREEVHLEVTPVEKVWEWTRPDGGLRLHFWTAHLKDGDGQPTPDIRINPDEVAEARWLTGEQTRALDPTIPNLIEFLDHWEANYA